MGITVTQDQPCHLISQSTLWEGLNEEATPASLTAALVQHPGMACGTTRTLQFLQHSWSPI